MMRFIEKPNLPEGKMKTLICGTDDERILSYFDRKGITVIKNAPNFSIDTAVSTHADMAVIHLGANRIITDQKQSTLAEELASLGMTVLESESDIAGDYPNDVGLNFAFVGINILGKFGCADETLLKETDSYNKVDVKQGYCKCSVLVVRENAIITDDEGIYRKATEKGTDSLLISKGDISLDGHPYGFIGGASGKISKDTVLFFGNAEKHSDFQKISTFLAKHGCRYECTDKGALRDIGGIIPLCEEVENIY